MAWKRKKTAAQGRAVGERHRPQNTASPRSFSYYASSRRVEELQKKDIPAKRQVGSKLPTIKKEQGRSNLWKRSRQHVGTVVVAGVLLVCVITVLQVDTKPKIVIVNNTAGYALHTPAEYEAVVTNTLRSSLLNSNKVTIDTQSVTTKLRSTFPEIYDATVVLPLVGQRPTVFVELTRPVLVLKTNAQSVLVDSTGRALVPTHQVTNLKSFNLPTVVDESQVALKVGRIVLSSDNVSFIQTVAAELTASKQKYTRLVLPAGSQQLNVYLHGRPYFVKFNLHENNARQQVGTLFAVQKQLKKQGTTPKSYIDVRLPGRAYFK